MTPAIHHMASAQMHADAIRDSLRSPRLPDEPKPTRVRQRRRRLVYRLRPAFV